MKLWSTDLKKTNFSHASTFIQVINNLHKTFLGLTQLLFKICLKGA